MKYIEPKSLSDSFTCPHCGVLSKQNWNYYRWDGGKTSIPDKHEIRIGKCQHCGRYTLWLKENMLYPDIGNCPFPNPEMPESVKKIYLEAAAIHTKSPRGAAALLRLAIQVLCKELGENGKNINTDISNLVKKGLPEIVQQSLDTVRVTGNDAVHPGQINTDDKDTVVKMYDLINVIVEYMIALPKKVSGLYSSLPKDKIDAINKRDKKEGT